MWSVKTAPGMRCQRCGCLSEEVLLDHGQMVCWPWCRVGDSLADARLKAAAPALLAACRAARDFVEHAGTAAPEMVVDIGDIHRVLSDAIAEATDEDDS